MFGGFAGGADAGRGAAGGAEAEDDGCFERSDVDAGVVVGEGGEAGEGIGGDLGGTTAIAVGGVGEGGAELGEGEGEEAVGVGGGAPGLLEGFVGFVELGGVELGEAGREMGVFGEVWAGSGVAVVVEVGEPVGVEGATSAFGVVLWGACVSHDAG